ncbi:MAG: hypothetical protein FJX31_08745 [Alphaproteobacteria bacterium]|nr:hypothetical protein [Alphaproteobacteria bacterium]
MDFALQAASNHKRLDELSTLVRSIVDLMPASESMAAIAAERLANRPFLRAEHETPLLTLLEGASGPLEFLRKPVIALLRTLWDNIGRGSNGDAGDLLVLFEQSVDSPLFALAVERLILLDRYRAAVVSRLCQIGDSRLIDQAGRAAALRLPFADAVSTIGTMRSSLGHVHLGAYTALAERFPSELSRHYEECLASGVRPRHREEVIAALGNYTDSSIGMPAASLAFDGDSDPRVRGVALLAMGSSAALEVFQPRLTVAIEDARVSRAFVVNALCNAAPRLDPNWLKMTIDVVLASGGVDESLQRRLEHLKSQYLPK